MGALCLSLLCYALLCIYSSFLKRKRELFALLLLSYRCLVTQNALWLFLTVPWVGLQCVSVVFPDHTHLLLQGKMILIEKKRLSSVTTMIGNIKTSQESINY